jgi:hypothetical protein
LLIHKTICMACVGKNSLVQMANVLVDCTNVLMDDAMHILIERFLLSQCATEVTIYMIREISWSLRSTDRYRFFKFKTWYLKVPKLIIGIKMWEHLVAR